MPAPWIIAAAGAGLLFVGGSLAAGEVCHTASPGSTGSSIMDMLPDSIEDVVGPAPDWLSPSTTAAAPTTSSSSARFDVKFSSSYNFSGQPEKACGVELGRMQNLTESQAACMIASGQYVASGASPSAAAAEKAKPLATKGSKVCSVEKPMWFWLWIPAALLAGLLAILEYSRREEGDPFSPVVEYPESDPDMPAPPVLDPNFRNNTQEK